MTTTLTNGALTFTPTLVDGYESERRSATIVHQILNRSTPDVTIRPAEMRTGTLRIVFADGAMVGGLYIDGGYVLEYPPLTIGGDLDSHNCEVAHADGGVWTLSDTDVPTVAMTYVPNGAIRRTLDEETRAVWIVEIDFHEVQA